MNSVVKDVDFNGSTLRAAQIDGNIWVGITWVCQGIGLNEDRTKYERKKIQKDLVLIQGVKFYPLGNGNSDSQVLCLMLDYLPLWLAKISITPKMKNENPKVIENLIAYQLKAKDVLADAFLSDKKEIVPTIQNNMLQIPLPAAKDYTEEFNELHKKISELESMNEKLYNGMSNMGKLLFDMYQRENVKVENIGYRPTTEKYIGVPGDSEWKQDVYEKAGNIVRSTSFKKTASVLKHIYDYMRQNYGICWEQEVKDYKEINKYIEHPKTIDIVYEKEDLRSIFMAVLIDMESKCKKEEESKIAWSDQQILPLVEKYNDNSNAAMHTYRKVYTRMEENGKISWKNLTTRYINEFGGKPTKKDLINTRKSLKVKFLKAVKELMEK